MSEIAAQNGLFRLDRLEPRMCAVIRSLDSEDEDTQRLKTLGFCVGRQVEVVKTGNPLIVRIFGSRLGLSANLAARVQVEPCGAGCACPVTIAPSKP